MNLKRLQARSSDWSKDYNPKHKRTPQYLIMHMVEELGEVAGDVRSNRIGRTFSEDEHGIPHPEGVGSEIADVILKAVLLADILGLDVAEDVEYKMAYLERKLSAKNAKRDTRRNGKKHAANHR